jgi:GT2 family glycosyltransferase
MPGSLAVDVVIPTWNGERLLAACLDALRRQTLAPGRVIVVDNGSTDGSRAVVEAAGAEWLALGENRGFPAAVNAGIAASDAPLVALLNNDAEPEPGWLEALVAAAEADPSISLFASRMRFAGSGLLNAAGDAFDVRGRGGYNRGLGESDGARFDEPRLVFGACAGAAMYRRTLFADIGLFDERFFLSWEDVDLDLRAALAGHRCLYVPGAVVHHRQGASSGPDRVALERRNKAWLAHKGLPLPLLALFLVLMPVREAYEARAAREGVADWVARVRPYLQEAPRAARWRHGVRRRASLRELWPVLRRESLPYHGPAA